MSKITKKNIREALKPISKTLHTSNNKTDAVVFGDLVVTGIRLYNARDCIGPVWNASYSASYNGQIMLGGNMDQIVDNIYRAINDPEWFKNHCSILWGERLKAA